MLVLARRGSQTVPVKQSRTAGAPEYTGNCGCWFCSDEPDIPFDRLDPGVHFPAQCLLGVRRCCGRSKSWELASCPSSTENSPDALRVT